MPLAVVYPANPLPADRQRSTGGYLEEISRH